MGAKNVTQKSRKSRKSCTKTKPMQTVPNGTVSRLTTSRPHPKGTVSKDRGRTQAPDAQHPQTLGGSPQTQHVHFQANLLIYLPKLSYIKYVTPEIKHTHYCDDSRFWDNHKCPEYMKTWATHPLIWHKLLHNCKNILNNLAGMSDTLVIQNFHRKSFVSLNIL